MRKKVFGLGLGFALFMTSIIAYGQDKAGDKQDARNADEGWIRRTVAVVRILNKLEASAEVVKIPVSQSIRYKTLTIEAQNCVTRSETSFSDSAAFLHITDTKLTTLNFAAWMFSSEPAVSVFEHPLYNVSVVGCAGEAGEEVKVNDSKGNAGIKSQENSGKVPSESLEDTLEHSLQGQH